MDFYEISFIYAVLLPKSYDLQFNEKTNYLRGGHILGFWNLFKTKESGEEHKSSLQIALEKQLPGQIDSDYIKLACISGLMTRVANVDLQIDAQEEVAMQKALASWSPLNAHEIKSVIHLAKNHSEQLSGLENHMFCSPLIDLLSSDERYKLLTTLFAIAASSEGVSNYESEEIRQITKALALSHQHFISARATVLEALNALK